MPAHLQVEREAAQRLDILEVVVDGAEHDPGARRDFLRGRAHGALVDEIEQRLDDLETCSLATARVARQPGKLSMFPITMVSPPLGPENTATPKILAQAREKHETGQEHFRAAPRAANLSVAGRCFR